MSLRFDKYFAGRTGAGAYAKDPGRIDLDAFIRQAAAAYHVLGARRETRPEALLVAGHSEGGLYALLTAGQVRPHPAGIALIEPMAEPLLSTIELQATAGLSAAVAAGTLDPAVAAGNASGVRHAIGEFRAERPVDTSGLLPDVVRRLRPGLLVAGERAVRAPGGRRAPAGGGRESGARHARARHRGHQGRQHPGFRDQAARGGPGRRRNHRTRAAGAGRDRPFPARGSGAPRNEPVLAPAAVAALTEWARPYAARYGA